MKVEIYSEIILPTLREAYAAVRKIRLPLTDDVERDIANMVSKNTAQANLFAAIKNIEWKIEDKKKEITEMAQLFREEKV